MSFSVIIPSRTLENLRPCVATIRAAHETCHIIVVDDFRAPLPEPLEPEALRECTWIRGESPFVFARNINLGIAAAGDDDVILLNDDTCLRTPFGFSYLASVAKEKPQYGIISAGITAAVGNEEQLAQPGSRLRGTTHHTLVFVCVYIRRAVLDHLQMKQAIIDQDRNRWLDERFEAYGYDDDDMCERVRQAGLKLGIFDGCAVEHGVLESTYRGRGSASSTDLKPNRDRFIEKWGFAPGKGPSMQVLPPAAPEVRW